MEDVHGSRSGSVIETSLTELAFIFFFILLTVSAWKINEGIENLKQSEQERQLLEQEVSQLSESLSAASELLAVADQFDPEELFSELTAGRKAVQQLESALQENERMAKNLENLKELVGDSVDPEVLAQKIAQHKEMLKALDEYSSELSNPLAKVSELIQQYSDIKGQNINLRNKLAAVGNGLDHPPCWADPKTGTIQYVFNVIINENSVEFKKGWPDSRADQAMNNPNIRSVIGSYSQNSSMWARTQALFSESEKQKCRHFVRIYDHADSKKAFKNYLLGVENHFYKYLSPRKHI